MRTIAIFLATGLCAAATPADAQEAEPHFAPFDVVQSPAPGAKAITEFDLAGAPVSLNAYGRKARARMLNATEESDEARKLGGAFDRAARPAVVTIEARVSF